MTDVVVRRARPEDVEGINDVRIRSWQAAYRGLIADAVLDAMRPDPDRTALHRQNIATRVDVATFVATTGADIIGFAGGGLCRDEEESAEVGELWAIYCDPSVWGRGVGHALHEATITFLRESAFTEAVVWMLQGNERAESFYPRQGWRDDHFGRTIEIEGVVVPEVRFRRSL